MNADGKPIRGRGSAENPPSRFDRSWHEVEPALLDPEELFDQPSPRTTFEADSSRTIVATNDSPDIPFEASINPYRGCEHGCAYCYARPTHEYLGYSAGLDFETRILVKHDAPVLLRATLEARAWEPKVIAMSGVTDAYQPAERRFRLTRGCLEVLAEFRNPVAIVTKNRLVCRDLDLLRRLADHEAAVVLLSVTTLDPSLARDLEPRTSLPGQRLAAIETLADAGIPVGILVAPVIPGLTDHELPSIVKAGAAAGASFAGHQPLRLPLGVGPLFEAWLDRHAPDRKAKVMGRVRSIHQGRVNGLEFGERMRGSGPFAAILAQMFESARIQAGLPARGPRLSTAAFLRPGIRQLQLFD